MKLHKKAHRVDGGQIKNPCLQYSTVFETLNVKNQTGTRKLFLQLIYWPLKLDKELRNFVFDWLKGLYAEEGRANV